MSGRDSFKVVAAAAVGGALFGAAAVGLLKHAKCCGSATSATSATSASATGAKKAKDYDDSSSSDAIPVAAVPDPVDYTAAEIAGMFDHAVLKPTSTLADVDAGVRLVRELGAASLCVLPCHVKHCAQGLAGSSVATCTVLGFPLGASLSKAAEATQAMDDGATELDMVVNISAVKTGDWEFVRSDISTIVQLAHARGCKVKVIFETCYLTDEEVATLSAVCTSAGADWVKTSTGFGTAGATSHHLQIMKGNIGPGVQMKASGGVRTLDQVLAVRKIGVTRIGTSSSKAIISEVNTRLG